MLFSIVYDPDISATELNCDLKTISKWAYQWKMSFNPEPAKQAVEVLFSQKKQIICHPPLLFNDSTVSRNHSHKHLGMTLDSKLSFIYHVNEKIKICKQHIGIIRYLNNYLPVPTLIQIYKSFVRPHLDYGDIIFHIPHSSNAFDSTISLHPLCKE